MGDFATITSKGQLTVPKSVRERHNLRPGDTVEFRDDGGRLWVEAKPPRAIDLVGILGPPPAGKLPKDDAELVAMINEAVAKAVAEDDERIQSEWRETRR